jgi:hypothetical protein
MGVVLPPALFLVLFLVVAPATLLSCLFLSFGPCSKKVCMVVLLFVVCGLMFDVVGVCWCVVVFSEVFDF